MPAEREPKRNDLAVGKSKAGATNPGFENTAPPNVDVGGNTYRSVELTSVSDNKIHLDTLDYAPKDAPRLTRLARLCAFTSARAS